jgi:hypothetical protein
MWLRRSREPEAADTGISIGPLCCPTLAAMSPPSSDFLGILVPASLASPLSLWARSGSWAGGRGVGDRHALAGWKRARYALDRSSLFVERGWWRHRRNLIRPQIRARPGRLVEPFVQDLHAAAGIAGGSGFPTIMSLR